MNLEDMIAAIKSGLLRVLPAPGLDAQGKEDPERYRLWVTSERGVTEAQAQAVRAFLRPHQDYEILAQLVVASDVRLCPTALVDDHRASYAYDRVRACFCCEDCKALQAAALAQATEEHAR